MTSGDWLPAQAPFDVVRRGYSPEQVTAHLERLEYDLRITTADRDATNQRLGELGGQLAAAQSEADALRAQLDRTALEPVSMSNLSDRLQRMIRLAEEEASEIRARSEADADRLRGQLEAALAEAAEARAAFDVERERTRKQLAEQVHGLIAEAAAEAADTVAQAQAESTRLVQEANAQAEHTVLQARQHAEQLVGEASAAAAAELAQAHAYAEQTVTAADEAAATVTADAAAERDRLDAASLAHRTQVEEDFEIAITARRAEAQRVITDREDAAAAAADRLVADATARSTQLVDQATAQAQHLVGEATAYSTALVERAAAEAHQRVSDADAAVLALVTLRAQLVEQLRSLAGHLDHIRLLAKSAPELILPPSTEQDRPVSAEFPPDPSARPTPVELPVPVLGVDLGGAVGDTAGFVPGRPAAPGAGEHSTDDAPADDAPADAASAESASAESAPAEAEPTHPAQTVTVGAAVPGAGSPPVATPNGPVPPSGPVASTARTRIRGLRNR